MTGVTVMITDHCVGCHKETTHRKLTKKWTGKWGKPHLIGKEYDAGYECTECGCHWDTI